MRMLNRIFKYKVNIISHLNSNQYHIQYIQYLMNIVNILLDNFHNYYYLNKIDQHIQDKNLLHQHKLYMAIHIINNEFNQYNNHFHKLYNLLNHIQYNVINIKYNQDHLDNFLININNKYPLYMLNNLICMVSNKQNQHNIDFYMISKYFMYNSNNCLYKVNNHLLLYIFHHNMINMMLVYMFYNLNCM